MLTLPVVLPSVPWRKRTRFSRRGASLPTISRSHQCRSRSMSACAAASSAANAWSYSMAVVSVNFSAVLIHSVSTNGGGTGRGVRFAPSTSTSTASSTVSPVRADSSDSVAPNASRRRRCLTSARAVSLRSALLRMGTAPFAGREGWAWLSVPPCAQ